MPDKSKQAPLSQDELDMIAKQYDMKSKSEDKAFYDFSGMSDEKVEQFYNDLLDTLADIQQKKQAKYYYSKGNYNYVYFLCQRFIKATEEEMIKRRMKNNG